MRSYGFDDLLRGRIFSVRWKNTTRRRVALGSVLLILGGLFTTTFWPIPSSRLSTASTSSLRITDRNGILLREVLSDQEGRGQWVSLDQISSYVIQATLAVEDGRFFRHLGVDPLAIVRALGQDVRARRIVAGGSTLTQQVIRTIYCLPRTLPAKIYEMWLALRLEHTLSKDEIPEQYLNRVPYGNQIFGIKAASRLYFDKPAADLSLAEASFLVGLPQSPTRYNPYRYLARAMARQRRVLRLMRDKDMISTAQYERATQQRLDLVPRHANFQAPHFVDLVLHRLSTDQRRVGRAPPYHARYPGAEDGWAATGRSREVSIVRGGDERGRRGDGPCHRRDPRMGGIGGLLRRGARRTGQRRAGPAAAGIRFEALHLWSGFGARSNPSDDPSRYSHVCLCLGRGLYSAQL